MQLLGRLPLLVLLIGIAGLAMLVPAGYAAATGWTAIAGYFAFSALLMLVVGLAALVFVVIAGIKANDGVAYRYPFALRLVK